MAIAGLLALAWRQPYARFVLSTVEPMVSAIVRRPHLAARRDVVRSFPIPRGSGRIVPWVAPPEFRRANVVVLMLESIPWSRLFGPEARPEPTPQLLDLSRQSVVFARLRDGHALRLRPDLDPRLAPSAQVRTSRLLHRSLRIRALSSGISSGRSDTGPRSSPARTRTGATCGASCSPRGSTSSATPPTGPRHRAAMVLVEGLEATPVDAFLAWVSEDTARPFVAYLNFQATHYPYVVPPGEPEPYQPSTIDFPTTFLDYPRDRIGVMENRFHNALAYVDRQTARVVRGLESAGIWENTALLVVSDHGEAFYEHGLPTHGTTLYEEQVRTAMFLRLPGTPPRVVESPVSVLDAVPVIVRALGLPPHGNFQGRDDILEPGYDGSRRLLPFTIQGITREDGLLAGDWKYIVNRDRGELALFDLAADPGEQRNLAATDPERRTKLGSELDDILAGQLAYYRDRGWDSGFFPPVLP
ncbi:MAG: sulfatase-like hydrolase/transferase [Thermoanaerobaculia bacterium]